MFADDVPEADRHLHYLITFDGFAQGDGVLDAMSHCGSDATRRAIDAFLWFGIPEPAGVVQRLWQDVLPADTEWSHDTDLDFDVLGLDQMDEAEVDALSERLEQFDSEYYAASAALQMQFREFYDTHPDMFAPCGSR